jgi:predicted dehydrogenase
MQIPYRPQDPVAYRPAIGLIGCGGITKRHLTAYRDAGYNVAALSDVRADAARTRRDEFFPEADVYTDYRELLRRDDVEVVDVATHPPERPPIVRDCLLARKHVLSQKPFVLDLDLGEELVELADRQSVKLAVNQNGRWAPHFSYARGAIAAGLIGDLAGVHMSVHWDHTWTEGTEFEKVKHLILYDFAIHWFDLVTCLMGENKPLRVYATTARSPTQRMAPPLLAQASIQFDHALASLVFDGDVKYAPQDRTYITGSKGTILSVGPDLQEQSLTMTVGSEDDQDPVMVRPELLGQWFPDAFHGTMGELLCSIEQNRRPSIDAAGNLQSLALCFAAVASAESGQPVTPGSVRQLPN